MSYKVLSPSFCDTSFGSLCALVVMAKAPKAGRVKTRLSPPLTLQQSAELNICFLRDTTQNLAEVSASGRSAGVISYTPVGDEQLFDGILPAGFVLVAQRGDGFGERLLAAAEDILACGFGAVCLIDSDSPTVPSSVFQQAVDALERPGDRIVIGGSDDGGYYLIGLKKPHPEPFANITWSTASVYAETTAAIRAAGIELIELPKWYDVDDEHTLNMLRRELAGAKPAFAEEVGFAAPSTRSYLAGIPEVSE